MRSSGLGAETWIDCQSGEAALVSLLEGWAEWKSTESRERESRGEDPRVILKMREKNDQVDRFLTEKTSQSTLKETMKTIFVSSNSLHLSQTTNNDRL